MVWAGSGVCLPVIVVSHNGPKNQNYPGLQGVTPWHVFAFFLRVKKEGGPQARPEKDGYSGLSAHTMRRQPDQEVDGAPPNPPYMI